MHKLHMYSENKEINDSLDFLNSLNEHDFCDYIISTYCLAEKNTYNASLLYFVRDFKEEEGLGLIDAKQWYDVLEKAGFHISGKGFVHLPLLLELENLNELRYILKYEVDLNTYSRGKKLKKIKSKIKKNV